MQQSCCHLGNFARKNSQISAKEAHALARTRLLKLEENKGTHSSLSFWQNSQASGLILLMAFWLRWSCCSISKP